jgi:hypothetical protein
MGCRGTAGARVQLRGCIRKVQNKVQEKPTVRWKRLSNSLRRQHNDEYQEVRQVLQGEIWLSKFLPVFLYSRPALAGDALR